MKEPYRLAGQILRLLLIVCWIICAMGHRACRQEHAGASRRRIGQPKGGLPWTFVADASNACALERAQSPARETTDPFLRGASALGLTEDGPNEVGLPRMSVLGFAAYYFREDMRPLHFPSSRCRTHFAIRHPTLRSTRAARPNCTWNAQSTSDMSRPHARLSRRTRLPAKVPALREHALSLGHAVSVP
jgi:hypothetical protein